MLNGQIQNLKPRIPNGFVVGMALGFSFTALVLPGIPLMVAALASFGSTGPILAFGATLTALGGVGLLVAIICLVMGNNAESDMADERAQLVERREQIKARLGPPQPPAALPNQPPVAPPSVPGVQLNVPAPSLVTVARF